MSNIRNYSEKIPTYGDLIPLAEWRANVKCGGFIEDDGMGHYAKDGFMAPDTNVFVDLPEDATHVMWFNK